MTPVGQMEEAMTRLEAAQSQFRETEARRREAILEAVAADIPLREVADVVGRSHEWVRRLVAADGQVMVETGDQTFLLSGKQVEMLIYKLAGTASGAFPGDVALLEEGDKWLPAAGELANAFQSAMSDEETQPVVLKKASAFALYQILRLTYFDGRSNLARLFRTLGEQLGQPSPHVIANARVRRL